MRKKPMGSAETLLSQLAGPNVRSLLEWMETNRRHPEVIELSQWVDDFWYLEIINQELTYPENTLIGFTFNVRDDYILFPGDLKYPKMTRGGNVYIRSRRWLLKFWKKWPDIRAHHPADDVGFIHYHNYVPTTKRKI